MDETGTERQAASHFTISAKSLSIASGVVAVAAVAALITVVGVTRSDALASVAIALAILAFMIQIIVLIADLTAANARDSEARQINAETRALLTRVDAQTAQISSVVSDQLAKLLDALLVSTKPGVKDGQDATIEDVRAALKAVRYETGGGTSQSDQAARVALIRTWPSASTLQRLIGQGIQRLPDACFPLLDILATDVVRSYEQGIPEGTVIDMPMYAEAAAVLVAEGYATQHDARLVLTHNGVLAASLIAAYDPVPEHVVRLWPELPSVRSRSQH